MSVVRRAVLLASSERYIILALTLGQTAVVSRLLTPEEIGISMIGVALAQVVDSLRDFGTTGYLIQQLHMTRESARTAFTVLFLISAGFAGALYASASAWAAFYDQPGLVRYLHVMAFGFLLAPVSAPLMALMRREFHFGSLCWINVGTTAVYATTLVVLAAHGFGYMSFAWATLLGGLATAILSLSLRPDFWIFRPSFAEWRIALAFGGCSSITNVLNRGYDLLPLFLLGRFFPVDIVGLYSRALVVSQLPDRVLLNSLPAVTLPAFAAEVRNGRQLKTSYLAAIGYITVVQWPVAVLLALLAHPLVLVLLGPQWGQSVPLVQLLALASMLSFPAMLSYPALLASGGLRDTLTASLISLPVSACIVFASSRFGPLAVAAAQFVTVPFQVLVVLVFIRRRIPFTLRELIGAARTSAVVTLATGVVPLAIVLAAGPTFSIGLPLAILAGLGGLAGWLAAVIRLGHPIAAHIEAVIAPAGGLLALRTRLARS